MAHATPNLWAQASPPAGPPVSDFTYDRGFLIAKATTLRRGEGYVAALFPGTLGVAYGATDRLTLQAGTLVWLPLPFASVRYAIIQRTPVHVALGAFGVVAVFENEVAFAAGWPYVTTTIGTRDISLTVLGGIGSSTEIFEGDFDGSALVQVMGEARLANGLKLIAETLSLGGDSDTAGGIGLRFFGRRFSLEGGVWRTTASGQLFPWAAVAFRW